MKKYNFLSLLLIVLMISGCASWSKNYGKLRILPDKQDKMTIQDLIDHWENYDIYYSDIYEGFHPRASLGVMFDPKNNDTKLVSAWWKKIDDQKSLIEATQWIYTNTQYKPWLNEILGPDGRLYGYLYYSWGPVILKVVDDGTMEVFNLEAPHEETDGFCLD